MRSVPISVVDQTGWTRRIHGEVVIDLGDVVLEARVERLFQAAARRAYELITGETAPREQP
jgi:hypothetical protein